MNQWITDTRLQRTAYHEAGHAVIATRMGVSLRQVRVYLTYRSDKLGHVTSRLQASYETSINAHGVYTAAGALAEFYQFGDIPPGSDGDDQRHMRVWSEQLTHDPLLQIVLLRQWRLRAGALLVTCWPAVESIAHLLIDRGLARLARRPSRSRIDRWGAAVGVPGQTVADMLARQAEQPAESTLAAAYTEARKRGVGSFRAAYAELGGNRAEALAAWQASAETVARAEHRAEDARR